MSRWCLNFDNNGSVCLDACHALPVHIGLKHMWVNWKEVSQARVSHTFAHLSADEMTSRDSESFADLFGNITVKHIASAETRWYPDQSAAKCSIWSTTNEISVIISEIYEGKYDIIYACIPLFPQHTMVSDQTGSLTPTSIDERLDTAWE